jgi:flagellar biosynthesis protein FlhG
VASGKGGAGKTSVAVNLAFSLASMGRKVCLLDADLGLSNVDVLLGIYPETTLEDVLFGSIAVEEAVINVGRGVDLISGGSGVPRLAELTRTARARLTREFAKLQSYDYLLIDNSPGITRQITSICLASREIVLVVNPEATSVTDAYALVKVLKENGLWWSPLLLVNKSASERRARMVFEKFKQTAQKHLKLNVRYLGSISEDRSLSKAALLKRALVDIAPGVKTSQEFKAAAMNLENCFGMRKNHVVSPESFLERSVVRFKEPALNLRQAPRLTPEIAALSHKGNGEYMVMLEDLDRIAELVRGFLRATGPDQRFEQVRKTHSDLIKLRRRLVAAAQPVPEPAVGPPASGPEERDAPAEKKRAESDEKVKTADPARNGNGHAKVAIFCPDASMRGALADLVGEAGLESVDGLREGGMLSDAYRLALVCWDRPDSKLQSILEDAGSAPLVLIKGYGGSRLDGLENKAAHVLDKPFKLDRLFGIINSYAA